MVFFFCLSLCTNFHSFWKSAFPKRFSLLPSLSHLSFLTRCHLPAAPSAQSALVIANEAGCSGSWLFHILSLPLCAARSLIGRLMSLTPIDWPPRILQTVVLRLHFGLVSSLFLFGLLFLPQSLNAGFLQVSQVGSYHWVHITLGNFFTAINTLYCCYTCKYDIFFTRI